MLFLIVFRFVHRLVVRLTLYGIGFICCNLQSFKSLYSHRYRYVSKMCSNIEFVLLLCSVSYVFHDSYPTVSVISFDPVKEF